MHTRTFLATKWQRMKICSTPLLEGSHSTRLPALFLVSLVLSCYPTSGASWGARGSRLLLQSARTPTRALSAGPSGPAVVTDTNSFIAALLNPSVTSIQLNRSIILNNTMAKAQLTLALRGTSSKGYNITRSLTVVGLGSPYFLLDLVGTSDIVRLASNYTLEFRSLRLRGLHDSNKLSEFPRFLTDDSTGTLRFINAQLQRTACPISFIAYDGDGSAPTAATNDRDSSSIPSAVMFAPAPTYGGPPVGIQGTPSPPDQTNESWSSISFDGDCFPMEAGDDISTLGLDVCYDQPLLVFDMSYDFSSSSHGPSPNGDNGELGVTSLKLSYNNTVLLCEVFVNKTCQITDVELAECIQELLDKRLRRPPPESRLPPPYTRPPSSPPSLPRLPLPPPTAPLPSAPPQPLLNRPMPEDYPISSKSPPSQPPSPPPLLLQPSQQLQSMVEPSLFSHQPPLPQPPLPDVLFAGSPRGKKSSVLLPALLSSFLGGLLFIAVLGGVIFWWRRLKLGAAATCGSDGGGVGGGKLEPLDSDQVAMQLPISDGGNGKAIGKASMISFGRDGKSVTSAAGTLDSSAGTALSSTLTGLTGFTPAATPAASSPNDSGRSDITRAIQLHYVLGAGSFGRVYYGTWQGQSVAVKIIPHSESANVKVQQEAALVTRFQHPNVVRALHTATFEGAALEQQHHLVAQLDSQRTGSSTSTPPGLNMETWIVLEYCDQASVATHLPARAELEDVNEEGAVAGAGVRASLYPGSEAAGAGLEVSGLLGTPLDSLIQQQSGADTAGSHMQQRQRGGGAAKEAVLSHMRGVLSIALDIAAGMSYLHSLNVCHGDLKCENVLLCSRAKDDIAEDVCTSSIIGEGASSLGTATAFTVASTSAATAALSTRAPQAITTGSEASAAAAEGTSDALPDSGGDGGGNDKCVRAAASTSDVVPDDGAVHPTLSAPATTSSTTRFTCMVPYVAKVADFGLSKAFSEASTHMSTATVGTVTHMCPVLLQTGQMRPSCDVFSFGIILWQLVTGGVPFAGMRYAEIVYKVAVAGMRPEFPPYVPRRLVSVAEACWAADPNARPSFEQLVVQLRELCAAAEDLQSELETGRRVRREGAVAVEQVTLVAYSSEDVAVANQWAAAAAAALLD